MFVRRKKKKKEIKKTVKTTFKRRKEVRKGVRKEVLPSEPIPEYLPVLTSDITDITPDELMFAYSWAKYPNNPKKALKESGIQGEIIPGTGSGGTGGILPPKKDLLKELIGSTGVQKAFREALVNKISALKATSDKSKKYLSCIAYLDKGDAFDDSGKLLSLKEMPFHVRVCVQEYEEKEIFPVKGSPYVVKKVKFSDNKDALKVLMNDTAQVGKEMNKLLGVSGNKNTFIQNITNTNVIGSGNNYSTLIQNQLDLNKLNAQEMDILFKALGIEADTKALQASKLVQEVIANDTDEGDKVQEEVIDVSN